MDHNYNYLQKSKKQKGWKLNNENKILLTEKDRKELQENFENRDEKGKERVELLDLDLKVTKNQHFDYLVDTDPEFKGFPETEKHQGTNLIHDGNSQKSDLENGMYPQMNNFLTKTQGNDINSEKEGFLFMNSYSKTQKTKFEDTEIPIEPNESNDIEVIDETQGISVLEDNSNSELDQVEHPIIVKGNRINIEQPIIRKRKVISAVTRRTASTRTRPSTARVNISKHTGIIRKIKNLKSVKAITEKVRIKSGKRRPKTGVNIPHPYRNIV